MLSVIMLNVVNNPNMQSVMLSVVTLNVIMLSVVTLNVIMLSAVTQNDIMLIVVTPKQHLRKKLTILQKNNLMLQLRNCDVRILKVLICF
jgi:hypothetical protein